MIIKYNELRYDTDDKYNWIDDFAPRFDKIVRNIVYDYLNSILKRKLDSIKTNIENNPNNLQSYVFITNKDVRNIYNKVYLYPTYVSVYGELRINMLISFYIARFIYQFYNTIIPKKNRKKGLITKIISYTLHTVVFGVLKNVRPYIISQISRLMSFSESIISKVYDMLYSYTHVDKETFIIACLHRFSGNIIYKYNPLKIKDYNAFLKTIFKYIMTSILRTPISTVDEDVPRYQIVNKYDQFKDINIYNSYDFLLHIYNSIETAYIFRDYTLTKRILYDTITDNYSKMNVVQNPVRLLYYIYNNIEYNNLYFFSQTYSDDKFLFNILSDTNISYNIKNNYPTLYNLIKAITIVPKDIKNNSNGVILSSRVIYNSIYRKLLLDLDTEYVNNFINDDIRDISKFLHTSFKSSIFLSPVTLTPIEIRDRYVLADEVSKLITDIISKHMRLPTWKERMSILKSIMK